MEFLILCGKMFHLFIALTREIFFRHLKRNFVSTQPLNIVKVVQFLGHYFVIWRNKVKEQKSAGLKYRSHSTGQHTGHRATD